MFEEIVELVKTVAVATGLAALMVTGTLILFHVVIYTPTIMKWLCSWF